MVVVIAWVVAVLSFGYMLPWAVAASRQKSNQASIGVLNLLFGWTIVGWFVTLIMACGAEPGARGPAQAVQVNNVVYAGNSNANVGYSAQQSSAGWYPSPTGPGRRYFDGATWTDHYAP